MTQVDILLPYWGDPELFKKAVNSVLAQSEQDWRLLVFDDFYPSDEAKKYISSLHDKRISYHRHKNNIGITKNFNYALRATKAPYCVMMGCDDIMMSNYIETALKNIGEADFYHPNVQVIDEDGNIYLPITDRIKRMLRPSRQGLHSGDKLAASLCTGNWFYFPSIMWKSSTLRKYGFDNEYDAMQDVIAELNIIKAGGTMYLDNETTFQYRRSAQSISSRQKGNIRFSQEEAVYSMFARSFDEMGWNKAAYASRWRLTSRLHHLITKLGR